MEKTIGILRIVDGEKLLRTEAIKHPLTQEQIDIVRWDTHMQEEAYENDRLPMNHKVWTTLVRRLILTIDAQQGRIVRARKELEGTK